MSTAVITIVAGRHPHLRRQQQGLAAGHRVPELYVVVGMGDPAALRQTLCGPLAATSCQIVTVPLALPENNGAAIVLPLAAARNAGAAAAVAAGADTLIFLDVDCIPAPALVDGYRAAVAASPGSVLHCGVVRYLDERADLAVLPLPPDAGTPHPARPDPRTGQRLVDREWSLFWSLSFAVGARDWLRLGGFDERYLGYGGEDTDLGYRAFRAGWCMSWLPDTDAYHQHHPTQRPPIDHLHDIVRNATIFHDRWGFWIMNGWLDAFSDLGLVHFDEQADRWLVHADAIGSAVDQDDPTGLSSPSREGAPACR